MCRRRPGDGDDHRASQLTPPAYPGRADALLEHTTRGWRRTARPGRTTSTSSERCTLVARRRGGRLARMIAASASTTPSASRRSRMSGARMRTVPVPPGNARIPRCSRRRRSTGALRLVSTATSAPDPRTSRISPSRRARKRPCRRSDDSPASARSVGPSAVRMVAFAAARRPPRDRRTDRSDTEGHAVGE